MSIASSISVQPAARRSLQGFLLIGSVGLAMAAALTLGRYPLSLLDIGQFILASAGLLHLPQDRYDLFYNLIVDIRLPRVIAATLIGASLSTSGAAYQAVFRNPLVSPDILGVLSGAAFGAALGLLLGGDWILVEVLAFIFGLAAAAVSILIASLFGAASIIMLVLGGLISSALFAALLTIVKFVSDPYNQLPTIIYWLMGSLGNTDLVQLKSVGAPMLLGILMLTALGRGLDALSMGDDEARALGVPVLTVRYTVIIAATLISALTVSIAGMIGWVGLLVPHLARLIVGPGNGRLLPVSAAFGAIFLLGADALSRSLGRVEIPIGILTELLGIPAFLLVLARARRSWV